MGIWPHFSFILDEMSCILVLLVVINTLIKKKEKENEKILKYLYLLRDYKSEGTFSWRHNLIKLKK